MASSLAHTTYYIVILALIFVILADPSSARGGRRQGRRRAVNLIDRCWRRNPYWLRNRQQLATCSVGFAGKMTNNVGMGVRLYTVTDPSDDPINPKFGTLRYGTMGGRVWITFQGSMNIQLARPLLIGSYTTIDGRGASVTIANGACFLLHRVHDVIIHGLTFHDCRPQAPGPVMGPGSKVVKLGQVDGDAVRLVTSSKVWIDHNTLYNCQDGLVDVTTGSTDVTISNNWFKNQNKVMLLGHDDGFAQDKIMRVTVLFNRFGPDCNQRMPRIRHGYVHVANNLYQGWGDYAIGGSMKPTVRSEANLFIAPNSGKKKVTWKLDEREGAATPNWVSVHDIFLNGAYFKSGRGGNNRRTRPRYNPHQIFRVASAKAVRSLTRSAGALQCSRRCRE